MNLDSYARKLRLPGPGEALPGRAKALPPPAPHVILGSSLTPPYPETTQQAVFALGCFWGAERRFWTLEGVLVTAVGYIAGQTPNPTYEEVCSGGTGHSEAVLVVFDAARVTYAQLLKEFWESHDPTLGMRQGNDVGTQYRSGIYTHGESQQRQAAASRDAYQERLRAAGFGTITTEILPAGEFYLAEDYHQQYLAKNPQGYCGLGGTGVDCPTGILPPAPAPAPDGR